MNNSTIAAVLAGLAIGAAVIFFTRGAKAESGPDAKVIAQLRAVGSNLSKPHSIEFFLYFPSREAADRVAAKMVAAGFGAKIDHAAKGTSWGILGTKTMVPVEGDLVSIRQQLNAWSKAEGGEYDGWGTEVEK